MGKKAEKEKFNKYIVPEKLITPFKTNKDFYFCILQIILLFAAMEYLLFYKGFYSISADESGRTIDAYEWFKGYGKFFSIWLPFQKILYAAVFNFSSNLFLLPRLISFAFGIVTLLSIIVLSYELFHNKIVSILTGFLSFIFPTFYIFSILPLSEIYFFFFTITAILFYVRWLNNNRYSSLGLSVVFLLIGTTTRYEAWVFAFVLFVMMVYRIYRSGELTRRKIILITAILITLVSFPLYWIYLSYANTHMMSGFISSVSSRYILNQQSIYGNVLYSFFQINITTLNVIGIVPLFMLYKLFYRVKQYALILFSTLIIFAVFSYTINAMPTHNFWRLSMIWSAMLIPFTAYFLYSLYNTAAESIPKTILAIILFGAVIYLFTGPLSDICSSSFISDDDIKTGQILRDFFKEDKYNAYVESFGIWDYTSLQITSESPERVFGRLNNNNNISDTLIYINNKLFSELKQKNISYIVARPFTKISSDSVKVTQLAKLTSWSVYKVDLFEHD